MFQGATYFENIQGKQVGVGQNQAAFSPINALQMAQYFCLPKQVFIAFLNDKYDNLLDLLQQEAPQ